MAILALILFGVYLTITFGLRTLIQVRRTGSTGFHGVGGRPGSVEWFSGVGFTLAVAIGAAVPVLALLDVVEPIAALDATAPHAVGLVLSVAGIGATFYHSWRWEPAGASASMPASAPSW